jgi:Reverse transcriptase (RNA-dependent DNA polymerase)
MTAFSTGDQLALLEWNRASFGLLNSGASFVRAMQKVLAPVKDFADSYVDDLAVFCNTWEEHLMHIDRTLQRVRESDITLTIKKSEFAKSEVKFCGQIIGSGRRRMDPDKIKAVMQIKWSDSKKEVRQILGLFGWFRQYLPNYAEV